MLRFAYLLSATDSATSFPPLASPSSVSPSGTSTTRFEIVASSSRTSSPCLQVSSSLFRSPSSPLCSPAWLKLLQIPQETDTPGPPTIDSSTSPNDTFPRIRLVSTILWTLGSSSMYVIHRISHLVPSSRKLIFTLSNENSASRPTPSLFKASLSRPTTPTWQFGITR